MTFSKMNNVSREYAPDELAGECANCSAKWTVDQLKDIADYDERVEAGCTQPCGECPECGATCYLIEPVCPTPPVLSEGNKANFETLRLAARNRHLVLVSAIRREDQKPVALVCAINRDGTALQPIPLAVMIEDNPFELFEDPFPDTGEQPVVVTKRREVRRKKGKKKSG